MPTSPPVTPAPLTLAPGTLPGTLVLTAATNPPLTGPSTLVVFPFVLSSSGALTPLPPVEAPGLVVTYALPQDGVLVFRAVQVGEEEDLLGVVLDGEGGNDGNSPVDRTPLLAQAGPRAYYLATTFLRALYHRLLLLTLQKELGPLPANNQPQVDRLTESLGKLDRGLQGATYLFQDTNYTECARTLELLSLTRYLP